MRWGTLLLLAAMPGLPAHARTHHSEAWAHDRFAAAERMSEALNGRPPADRTRHDYQRVINAYRNVYYGAPTSTKADPSVVAVAETLVEMGRRFDDEKILKEAIAQYRFLRREYPGSKYRSDALFTIGEIYKDDLNDPEQARATFQEFLHRYPQNRLFEDAQQSIGELDHAQQEQQAADRRKLAKAATAKSDETRADGTRTDVARTDVARSNKEKSGKDSPSKDLADAAPLDTASAAMQVPDHQAGHLPRVTGIRHWSTPDYTRVAIDLESGIKFGSQRIAHPDRIFFDLRGTKLASTLVGKTFDVDDGFLKKIRVAQFQPGRTRVVLEVDDLSDYDAFLLPNPYRLIIDIHGKNATGNNSRSKSLKNADHSTVAAADVDPGPEPGLQSAEAAVKADLKADAGKAPVTSEEVGDDAKIASKGGDSSPKLRPATQSMLAAKTPSAPVKKVVEADDDDQFAPTRTVNETLSTNERTARGSRSKTSSRLGKNHSADLDIREARPTASGDRSLIRALGLKIGKIVIDPGHGGHDTGTIGPNGLEEKDLVLEVGRRLGKMLEMRLGAEVVYTRKDDTFIPLETRTAIANQQRADLFISIHANSSHDPDARGVETYYLNFTSSPEALEVAARENAVSEKSIYELQDLVKKIALKEKIEESREFAGDVQQSLHSVLAAKSPGIRNRGVKKAPFIVLIGANMPSILAEISFVSNPTDERRLETSEYRQRIAESLYRGISKYVNGLSGVKVASKLDKAAGQ
jgi:N-acetylmuramoyl-L-alanine amidase